MPSVAIFYLAESNFYIQFALSVLAIALTCCPLIYNIEQLIVEFTPESAHEAVSTVSNIFYSIFVGLGVIAMTYLYFTLDGLKGSLKYIP